MSKKVSIIDYGLGNLFSVRQACKTVGLDAFITADPDDILSSDMVILPGVGAYGVAMKNLEKAQIIQSLREFVKTGKPFIGICLGMQLMLSESLEFGQNFGLDFIPGKTKKFKPISIDGENFTVPQIQWNQLKKSNSINKEHFFNFLNDGVYMYFVHSFYCEPDDDNIIVASTNYAGIEYPSIIQHNNCIGIQFHPEKSGKRGIEIYNKFLKII